MVQVARGIIPPDTLPRGIDSITHPEYLDNSILWEQWRLTYGGGVPFVNRYLKQFSNREDATDFASRKELTYVPAFAKQAIDEIKYALMQRMCDVIRAGGAPTWLAATRGEMGGVDLLGRSMNGFVNKEISTELLVKGKCGVYVDAPELIGSTLADKGDAHPYLKMYWAEDIRSWVRNGPTRKFTQLLLRDWSHSTDPVSGLPLAWGARYRYLFINPEDGYVYTMYFGDDGKAIDTDGSPLPQSEPIRLDIREIPFVVGELDHSLMVDIASYQIAMMNMASADVDFCVKANYPFYTEMRDTRIQSDHLRTTNNALSNSVPPADAQGTVARAQAEQVAAVTSTTPTARTGVSYGRRYGFGLDRPQFIHPSSEPLKASMEKQLQMKAEIRELVHLSVSRLDPAKASAESKMQDEGALENGLSVIGQELERMERRIAYYWKMYEGQGAEPVIKYPTNYSLTTDEERRKSATDLAAQLSTVPSKTFQKEIAKEIAVKLLGHKISTDLMEKIKTEINEAQAMTTDSKTIVADLENHLVSAETASLLRGYKKGEAAKALEEQAARLALIQASQAPVANPAARGNPDASVDPKAEASAEKAKSRDTTADPTHTDKTRGEGK